MYDVEAMIHAADLEAVLGGMGVTTSRRRNQRGYELYFNCINPEHEDTGMKMSIAEEGRHKGLFNCWSCKSNGNIIHIIQHFCKVNFVGALEWLQNRVGVGELQGTESLIYRLKKDKLNYGATEDQPDLGVYELPADFVPIDGGRFSKAARDYLVNSRRIDLATCNHFGVGCCNHPQIGYAIAIPIYFDGAIRSVFYGQPVDGGDKRYPAGAPQGKITFNWDKAIELNRYVMVESILDVLMMHSMGIPHGTACFTNMISDAQLELCKSIGSHSVFPDRDSPRGWDLVDRMVGNLDKSVEIVMPPLGKDPGDCEAWEVVEAFANRRRYSDWEIDNYMRHNNKPTGIVNTLKKL